ncbi:hypothetical protein Tdes44962_MAKER02849 [Teratosphaeria destructans]|uniref:Uncharacterized protein n=1 Tax=Teratosphaeria destructans TaxID=418781 RepID=A0A9W7SRR4_9PEZI|nr:hypothetical protein Tdes44962_MAKER02849 [Teratosphaeria destructans]
MVVDPIGGRGLAVREHGRLHLAYDDGARVYETLHWECMGGRGWVEMIPCSVAIRRPHASHVEDVLDSETYAGERLVRRLGEVQPTGDRDGEVPTGDVGRKHVVRAVVGRDQRLGEGASIVGVEPPGLVDGPGGRDEVWSGRDGGGSVRHGAAIHGLGAIRTVRVPAAVLRSCLPATRGLNVDRFRESLGEDIVDARPLGKNAGDITLVVCDHDREWCQSARAHGFVGRRRDGGDGFGGKIVRHAIQLDVCPVDASVAARAIEEEEEEEEEEASRLAKNTRIDRETILSP